MPFTSTGLRPDVLAAMAAKGYSQPTPVQTQAIPAVLLGQDVLACAPTGSGKTAAFALPLLQRLLETATPAQKPLNKAARALVLVPTRELAVQVGTTLRDVANRLPVGLRVTVVFGGVSINPQMLGLRGGTDVVVATPGRLLDLLAQNALGLGSVRTLVLDEADRLLDTGFADEWARIARLLPAQRQNLLFSATFAPAVQTLAESLLREPVRIHVAPVAEAAPDIEQLAISVDVHQRTQLLRHLVETERWSRVLVFVATQHAADTVAEKLRKARISAEPFHGALSQGKRTQVLADFKLSRVKVVVATDLAARALDITDLPVVVNHDLPRSAEDYTHRMGRTGRAGASGLAVSFVSPDTEAHLRLIEKRHGLSLKREVVRGFEPDSTAPTTAQTPHATQGLDPNGGIKGKRPSKKDKLRAEAINKDS
jgi:ATP-dependent RNA helicase RhlE